MPKSTEKPNKWSEDFLRGLDKLPLEEARKQATFLVQDGSTRDNRKSHLVRDLSSAKSSAEISRIMYNAFLSGSGMGVEGSKWSRTYGRAT